MANLRPKEIDYLIKYYGPREHQFVYVYTKHLPNLGAKSTQRVEGMHSMMKQLIIKHTTIQDSVAKIVNEMKNIFAEKSKKLNRQRHKLFRLIDRNVFTNIKKYITYEAIKILIRECNSIMQLTLKIELENLASFEEKKCLMKCELSMQYKLLCKC